MQEAAIDVKDKEAVKHTGRACIPELRLKGASKQQEPSKEFRVSAGYGFAARTLARLREAIAKLSRIASARPRQSRSVTGAGDKKEALQRRNRAEKSNRLEQNAKEAIARLLVLTLLLRR